MATDPARHPFDDEIDDILASDPEFVEETRRRIAAYREGRVKVYDHAEVVQRMCQLGVPLNEVSEGPERPRPLE